MFGPNGRSGDFDPNSMESLQLTQAITNAHLKLLFAEKRDGLMQIGNAENSYRHRKLNSKNYGIGMQRYASILLVPPVGQTTESRVARLKLEMPTVRRERASGVLRNVYMANIEQNAPKHFDSTSMTDLSRPKYIPTLDIFGEAVDAEGHSIKFLLSPTGLHAYEFQDDISVTAPELQAAGQQYIVDADFTTYEAQAELVTEWFDTAELTNLIATYEPMAFDGTSGAVAS